MWISFCLGLAKLVEFKDISSGTFLAIIPSDVASSSFSFLTSGNLITSVRSPTPLAYIFTPLFLCATFCIISAAQSCSSLSSSAVSRLWLFVPCTF